MRAILVGALMILAACSEAASNDTPDATTPPQDSSMPDVAPSEAGRDASAAGANLDAAELPHDPTEVCDGTRLRHVCEAYAFVGPVAYGVEATCMTAPWLPGVPDGGDAGDADTRAYRAHGQEGCIDVGHPGPAARCCP